MHAASSALLICASLVCSAAQAADAGLPRRDLTVELRQSQEGAEQGSRHSAGPAANATWEPQMVQVRNGQKALLRMNDAIPMQWTQSVSGQNPAAAQTGRSAQNSAHSTTGVTNALVWFDAGQSISVQPKWPGGNKPAVVEIEVQRAAVGSRLGADLPAQTRNTVSTTLTVPLAEWVTIAATGRAPKAGVYSSDSGSQVRRLLQIRVMAP